MMMYCTVVRNDLIIIGDGRSSFSPMKASPRFRAGAPTPRIMDAAYRYEPRFGILIAFPVFLRHLEGINAWHDKMKYRWRRYIAKQSLLKPASCLSYIMGASVAGASYKLIWHNSKAYRRRRK